MIPEEVYWCRAVWKGQLKELLKYRVKRIDYVEINPALIDAAKVLSDCPKTIKSVTSIPMFGFIF